MIKTYTVNPEECKNARGEWIKWIPERLNEEEMKKLDEFNVMCDNNMITDHLSQNHRLRFLSGCVFNL